MFSITYPCLYDLDFTASDLIDFFPNEQSKFKNTTTARKNFKKFWTEEEKLTYFKFIKNNSYLFDLSVKERKEAGIHVLMSKEIKTRTSLQCRSHHQKMLKKYGSIQRMIAHFSQIFKKEKQSYKQHVVNLIQQPKFQLQSQMINFDQIVAEMREETIWEKVIERDTTYTEFLNI